MSETDGLPMSRPSSRLQVECSRHFPAWLAGQSLSLAFSTYQAGKLFLVGLKEPDDRLSVFERTFNRCMGLWADTDSLWLASAFELWRLENNLDAGETADGFDRVYVPRSGYVTGDIDIHDVAVAGDGRVVFVNTLFSCLATVSDRHSFEVLWRPRFISRLAAEDRCHLNGLALEPDQAAPAPTGVARPESAKGVAGVPVDRAPRPSPTQGVPPSPIPSSPVADGPRLSGRPRYVTSCSQADVADGWRDSRARGGCVIDVTTNEVIVAGLSMPHSPRLHAGRLWLLDSGSGYFGWVDFARGMFERVAFCPGYARGLALVGDYAVMGLSKPRHERTFSGLPLDEELARHNASARCGLQVIDLRSGDVVHWLRLEGIVEELYDVALLPGVRRPKALGFKTDEIRFNVSFQADGVTRRWFGRPK